MTRWDVLVVGGGPAGAVCAAHCAAAGWRTLVVERSCFPRDKVCGDCLNPGCWPILERLGVAERVLAQPHGRLQAVAFAGVEGEPFSVSLGPAMAGEVAVKRAHLDAVLLARAEELGATVLTERCVTAVVRQPEGGWKVTVDGETYASQWLVAADGRNSAVSRLLGILPPARKDRVGLQTHLPLPEESRERAVMRFLPTGYSGLADIGGGEGNLCLVARPENLAVTKAWATARYGLPADQPWRSITPLQRGSVLPRHGELLLVGDAARVVEPFTGEGIFYALATGELAGQCLVNQRVEEYAREHRALYRGRLWINQLARAACMHPQLAAGLLRVGQRWPEIFRALTHRVTAVTRERAVIRG